MIHAKNVGERSVVLPQKDGKGSVEILPGKTEAADIDAENPHVDAKVRAGLIVLVSGAEAKAEAKAESGASGGRRSAAGSDTGTGTGTGGAAS